ncbi:AAA family ATPase, partial [Desulfovibrio desulfuricans]|nr:AAA family ATPase [Desulfovibrio desulfuricans]
LNGYYDDMVFFLKNMLSAALKTNDALEKGILTGCLRIARESIFTGLNNFKVITIFDDTSNQQFGFTQKEMDLLLSDYQAEAYRDKVKEWYDGYQFGSC